MRASLALCRHISSAATIRTYRTAQREQRVGHLRDVFLLVQVDGLEDVLVGHAVRLQRLLEVVDVLHHLELAAGRVHLGHRAGLDLVDQRAQHLAVLQHILVRLTGRELGANDGLDPRLRFRILGQIALAGDLRNPIVRRVGKLATAMFCDGSITNTKTVWNSAAAMAIFIRLGDDGLRSCAYLARPHENGCFAHGAVLVLC